jgi:dihydrofolate synthase/folylpolyglutamate synthase
MIQNLEEWVFARYGQEFYTPGLERMGAALRFLKPFLQKSKITIIAGTNGKGETTHRLSRYFSDSTFCAWTSPHIESMTERFSSEDGNISESELEALILESHEIAESQNFQLSYYEFLFFVFCRWAVQKGPKFLFLEVGLGGKLDAVNVLDANLVLLTSISRDHQEFLGPRYDQILQEKLGVLRENTPLIHFLDLKYLQERINHPGPSLNLSLFSSLAPSDFSLRNQFLAYAACCHLKNMPFRPRNWQPSEEKLFARGEIVQGVNEWWLYGSHNVDGVRKLIQFLHSANYNFQAAPFKAVVTSFSKRNEKDLRVMLKMLKRAGLGEVLVTSFEHTKAYPKEALRDLSSQEGLKFVENIADHVQGWTHQKILVVGSYYFLGQLKPLLRSK